MADSNYNGYSWKQREKILNVLSRRKRDGFQPRHGPCDICGDPGKKADLHSEDYSEPFTFEPPQTYLLCKACHLRLHKRFNDSRENWALFLTHLRAGGYGAEFTERYSVAQRREWQVALAGGNQIELPLIRQRQFDPVPWWEMLTLDPESLDAAWARPRPLRPRPTVQAFLGALEQITPSPKELALLRCHAACEKHTATMRHLAQHALDSSKPNAANLIYGSLARRLCEAMPDWKPDFRKDGSPVWMSIIAEGWQPKAGEFEWVLVPELRIIFGGTTD
jgi:hypothetical protein